ncbi:MAG: hypothetical protein QNJ19_03945 [Woeseiaceae bacterium]|nr:hypothetical protein [Woeseiaceae bacterium]
MKRVASLFVLLLGMSAAGADVAALKGNPFTRPPSAPPPGSTVIASIDGPVPQIDLQATMVAAGRGLANVGGRILRPGQSIEELTLVEVYEDRAVFLHRGDRLTVYVKPHLNESEDED